MSIVSTQPFVKTKTRVALLVWYEYSKFQRRPVCNYIGSHNLIKLFVQKMFFSGVVFIKDSLYRSMNLIFIFHIYKSCHTLYLTCSWPEQRSNCQLRRHCLPVKSIRSGRKFQRNGDAGDQLFHNYVLYF